MEAVANFLIDSWYIILTILGFSFIIFVHELGHFIMAKRAGVKVDKFYVGFDFFGLKVFSIVRNETEYGIGIFPFGGYVKLHGYEELPGHETEIKNLPKEHFHSKSVGERLGIMVGGVAMNFISAVFLILIMYSIGKEEEAPIVGTVQSIAAMQGGLKEDDKIISINDKDIKTFMDIRKKVILTNAGEPLNIKIERNKEIKVLTLTPDMNYEIGAPDLGVYPQMSLKIGSIYDGSPVTKAGLLPGDKIETVNGKKIEKYYQFEDIVEKSPNQELTVGVLRNDKPAEFKLTPSQQPSFLMRFESGLKNNNPIEVESVSPHTAAEKAGIKAWDKIVKINDKLVTRIDDIAAILAEGKGSEAQLEIIRNETKLMLPITPIYNSSERKFMLGIITSNEGVLGAIENIEVNGPAYSAGLRAKDKIVAINDQSLDSVRQMAVITRKNYGKTVNITYSRLENGEWKSLQSQVLLRTPTRMGFITKLYHKTQTTISKNNYIYDDYGLGVTFSKNFMLAEPLPESQASKAGFQKDDKLLSISFKVPGEEKNNIYSSEKLHVGWNNIDPIFSFIASRMNKKGKENDIKIKPEDLIINIKFEREGKQYETSIIPKGMEGNKKGFSGIGHFREETVLYRYSSVGEAASLVYTESLGMLEFTVSSFTKLVSGNFNSDALSGPFGIIPLMHQIAKSGIVKTLWFVAWISINIAFMNFLPFPPLDGGAVFFLLIEKLKGSPVSAKFQIVVANIGVMGLIALMLFVTMNDISKFVG